MFLGQVKRKMTQEQVPTPAAICGGSLANASRTRDKHLPQRVFVGGVFAERSQKSEVMYINLQINELHTIIFRSAPLGR